MILGKNLLDQTIAQWMLPLLPSQKRDLWNQPSMYGSPDKQTVGGAVVSFLLRPCAFRGLVVFGERRGTSPEFTSCRSWTGHDLLPDNEAPKKLVRKYLHCYGPATVDNFISWAGCSGKQGRRMWNLVSHQMYAPLRGIFGPNSVSVAHYVSFIGAKSPTKCDAHLAESNFQTRSKALSPVH